jgi:hypothetical protein
LSLRGQELIQAAICGWQQPDSEASAHLNLNCIIQSLSFCNFSVGRCSKASFKFTNLNMQCSKHKVQQALGHMSLNLMIEMNVKERKVLVSTPSLTYCKDCQTWTVTWASKHTIADILQGLPDMGCDMGIL